MIMNRMLASAVFVATAFGVQAALAQSDGSNVEIQTTDLGNGIYLLAGAGGNIVLSVGESGTFIVDDELAELTDKVRAAIAAQTDMPVSFILNTHWHFDHVGGNESFGGDGAVIIAHHNVRERMSGPHYLATFDMEIPPSPDDALPVVTFEDGLTLHLNGEEVQVTHVAPAHTDGDAIVQFHGANVLHTGDLWFNGFYPFIDQSSGGSVMGMIDALDMVLGMVDDETKIIPGHGPLGTKADLEAYRDLLIDITIAIQAHIDDGMTLEETIAARPTAAHDDPWGLALLTPEQFVSIVYASLSQ